MVLAWSMTSSMPSALDIALSPVRPGESWYDVVIASAYASRWRLTSALAIAERFSAARASARACCSS